MNRPNFKNMSTPFKSYCFYILGYLIIYLILSLNFRYIEDKIICT